MSPRNHLTVLMLAVAAPQSLGAFSCTFSACEFGMVASEPESPQTLAVNFESLALTASTELSDQGTASCLDASSDPNALTSLSRHTLDASGVGQIEAIVPKAQSCVVQDVTTVPIIQAAITPAQSGSFSLPQPAHRE